MPVVTRFAPAPTGYLHLGHVLNAVHVWDAARSDPAGRVLLRIEDHDRQRSRAVYEDAILDDLAWLGFVADGPFVRQSERYAIYENALASLRDRGLVYACSCSRSDFSGQRYPGACRDKRLREGPGLAVRVRLDETIVSFADLCLGAQTQQPSAQCGDLLARDREGNWTYQFAVTVDDWEQEVNLVVRGEDLLESTGRQILLARLLGRSQPPAFLHHPLLMKSATQKLSKSDGDTGIRELRANGWTPEEVISSLANLRSLRR
ncbi:MAG TPA: glutamate--tRNA ligase family protein [Vicinamibacterales bacterium]|nr:glutamate--tRNA ligase family protein [Vicinamibacterales bacterium]